MYDDDNEFKKVMLVLENFLSLHEADEIYNMLFDNKVYPEDIKTALKKYEEEES